MDTLITWAKGNYDIISILVGIIGLIIGFISVVHALNERKRKKRDLKNQIATKEAQLHAMEMSMKAGFNALEYGGLEMQKSALQAEIEQLKKQL